MVEWDVCHMATKLLNVMGDSILTDIQFQSTNWKKLDVMEKFGCY